MRGLDDMYVFKMVVDHGGLSPAGRQMGVAKSTLARRLADLERRLGAPLFHRGPRQFVLTSFGQECYRQCARVAAEADRLLALAERLQAVPTGSLHVIAPPYLSEIAVEGLATEFALAHPHVRLHFEASALIFDPRFVSADLVIYPAFEALPDADIVARKLITSPFALMASPDLPGLDTLADPSGLAAMPCLGFGRKTTEWLWRLRRGRETSVVRFEPRFSTYHLSALLQAARQGLGIAALPLDLCAEELRRGRLVRVLEDWLPPPVNIFAVYPGGRTLTTAARSFLDMLVQRLPGADFDVSQTSRGRAQQAGRAGRSRASGRG